ncbi:hypothetical protein O6H91_06G054600 [Diphasiastrum complanatum]|uniref:Uncharacterized protein n=10 Tax=Diphasiastrum complanatum TaxID=34168 RepID=A0ACC2DDM8_DIPCM|nr:hypothetical protein O6H91_06G054600 [Diphasiastrum complanatum]KAJ7552415.1 hypothetical protein O6H91_06G054600 [Diphasiastrum complanatum]KAJ7552416.1 hypothetical protein O6H91_06G054600 [Diphasiastrum complanatum]KAJ7552417.1 hypothetical protein O6H91_06G054600 [Diphasiastrum complanatum]KAJ7552418.1 hypothetical protein O6H91_06G054600 [Diphasiastrum complanatum]
MNSPGRNSFKGKGQKETTGATGVRSSSDFNVPAVPGDAAKADLSLEELLKPMLPPGVPLLDFDHLDYSFAIEYKGPPIKHPVPKAEVVDSTVVSQKEEPGSPEAMPVKTTIGAPSSSNRLKLRKPSLDVQVFKGVSFSKPPLVQDYGNTAMPSPVTGLFQGDLTSPVIGLVRRELTPPLPLPRSSLSKAGPSKDVSSTRNSLPSKKQLGSYPSDDLRTEAFEDHEPKFPDSPESAASMSSVASETYLNSGMTSASRKSSASEIEEVHGQTLTSNSASASVPLSQERHIISKSVSMDWHQNGMSALGDSVGLAYSNVGGLSGSGQQRSMSLPATEGSSADKQYPIDPVQTPFTSFDEPDPILMEQRKKGECYRCLKGNRLIEKEACLVCSAKYCKNCVLIAMGSMPEGRKCVKCIGQPIHESRRPSLGKPSRLLKRLLSPQEVQQIMKAEKKCPANQLRPEQLFVNSRVLTPEDLAELLGCSNPPFKLKPGRYWYDKVSGLWGKEGEKPDTIITPQLKVGGELRQDASNGCTQVHMNGREISKTELKMLKLAGVQCPPKTYLQLFPDGKYVEEGQNNIKGNIWGKKSRILYPFFSLPTPRGSSRVSREYSNDFSNRYIPEYLDQKKVHKLLLLGHEGSGRSTIFKQAKFLYQDGFTQKEMQKFKEMIQRNLYKYLVILLEGRERFEEEEEEFRALMKSNESHTSSSTLSDLNTSSVGPSTSSGDPPPSRQSLQKNRYTMDTRLKHLADWFLDITADGSLESFFPAATREYACSVDELWRDPAIQATYRRKDELHMLSDVAGYFLERAVELSSNEYEPSDYDILCAEGLTQGSGLAEIEFPLVDREPMSGAFNDTVEFPTTSNRYQLIRVGGIGLSEGRKWLDMFEDVRAVIFCVAISEYDQIWTDINGVLCNKMILSKELFENIVRYPCFRSTPFVLLMNKYDIFEEKLSKGIPLTTCEWFSDYSPVGASNSTQAQQAYTYLVHKFKKLLDDRKLYTFSMNAQDRTSVAGAFQYIKEILKWEENKAAGWGMLPEDLSYSDMSSFSTHSHMRQGH